MMPNVPKELPQVRLHVVLVAGIGLRDHGLLDGVVVADADNDVHVHFDLVQDVEDLGDPHYPLLAPFPGGAELLLDEVDVLDLGVDGTAHAVAGDVDETRLESSLTPCWGHQVQLAQEVYGQPGILGLWFGEV